MGRWDNSLARVLGMLATVAMVGFSVAACDKAATTESQETTDEDTTKAEVGEVGRGPSAARYSAAGGTPEAESYLADLGFRPDKNGFSFPNGDRDPKTLQRRVYPYSSMGFFTVDSVVRMFGSKNVCMSLEDGVCNLTPPASEFMDTVNRKLNGGQCEGMAVGSMTLFKELDKVSAFSKSARKTYDLKQDEVRGMLGYYWAYQMVDPYKSYWRDLVQSTTPNQTLDRIITSFQKGQPLVMAFWAPPQPGGRPGHAVAPYAVEDRGNSKYWVRIYDNNFPGVSRYVEFDKNNNTWRYDVAAVNPDSPKMPWYGDATTKGIIATELDYRLQDATCHFCPDTARQIRQIWLSGGGRATVTDASGGKIGYDEEGKWINTIKGAIAINFASYLPGEPPPQPIIEVPAEGEYDIEVNGTNNGDKASLSVFGQGTALVVNDLDLDKGDKDVVGISKDAHGISFKSSRRDKKPKVRLALGQKGAKNYVVKLDKLRMEKGKKFNFHIDPKAMSFRATKDGKDTDNYDVNVVRFGKKGKKTVFGNKDVKDRKSGFKLSSLKGPKGDDKEDVKGSDEDKGGKGVPKLHKPLKDDHPPKKDAITPKKDSPKTPKLPPPKSSPPPKPIKKLK